MENIFEIATKISTPLALAGLISAILFFVIRQLLAQNIFPKLTRQLSSHLFILIINRLFILSLVAMSLGFLGFVFTQYIKQPIGVSEENIIDEFTLDEFLQKNKDTKSKEPKVDIDNSSVKKKQESQLIEIEQKTNKSDPISTEQVILKTSGKLPLSDSINNSLNRSNIDTNSIQKASIKKDTKGGYLTIFELDNGQYSAAFPIDKLTIYRAAQQMPNWGWASGLKTLISYKGHQVSEITLLYGREGKEFTGTPTVEKFEGEYEDFVLEIDRKPFPSIENILKYIDKDEPFLVLIQERAYIFSTVYFTQKHGKYQLIKVSLLNCFDPSSRDKFEVPLSELNNPEILTVNYIER